MLLLFWRSMIMWLGQPPSVAQPIRTLRVSVLPLPTRRDTIFNQPVCQSRQQNITLILIPICLRESGNARVKTRGKSQQDNHICNILEEGNGNILVQYCCKQNKHAKVAKNWAWLEVVLIYQKHPTLITQPFEIDCGFDFSLHFSLQILQHCTALTPTLI